MPLDAYVPSVTWAGSGATASVALSVDGIPVSYADRDYLSVQQLDDEGNISTLQLGVDYDIDLLSVDPDSDTPATITRLAGNLPDGYTWVIDRQTPVAQLIDLVDGGDFASADIENMSNRGREIDQEIKMLVQRALRASRFDTTVDLEIPPMFGKAGQALVVATGEQAFDFSNLAGVTFDIGTVTTLPAGSQATAQIVGGPTEFFINLGIPKGDQGQSGSGAGDLLAEQNLNDVASKATAFNNIKQAASTDATGVVERAIDAEAAGGSDATRYITSAQLHEASVNVASASTTDIGAAASNFIIITGSETINSFGTAPAGVWRHIIFAHSPLLVYNGSSLLLPGGGVNIQAVDGDRMLARSLGSGVWYVLLYQRNNGQPLALPTASNTETAAGSSSSKLVTPASLYPGLAAIASASTCDIGAADSSLLLVSGTTTINSFGNGRDGLRRHVIFDGVLTLTHSVNLVCPSSANITTAAGDWAELICTATNTWRIVKYQRATGRALVEPSSTGKLVARAYGSYTTNADITAGISFDDTIPQNSEGTEILSASITPSSSSNRLRIRATGWGEWAQTNSGDLGRIIVSLFSSASADALQVRVVNVANIGSFQFTIEVEYAPSTTSALTISCRIGTGGQGSLRLNGTVGARRFGGASSAAIVVEELVP